MSEPAEHASVVDRVPVGAAVEELGRRLGLRPEVAQALVGAGYTTPDEVRGLSDARLIELGVPDSDLPRLRAAAEAPATEPPSNGGDPAARGPVDGQAIVGRWMDSVRKSERPKRRAVTLPAKDSRDVLKKWVEGDDRAMEAWIQSSETERPPAGPIGPGLTPAPAPPPATPVAETSGASTPGAPAPLPPDLLQREATVVRWLTDLLDRVKGDQFDPASILQEIQDLQRQLYEERGKRKQLEDQIEHVKRGSIAVIKYVRSREAKAREQAVQAKDAELADLRLRLLQGGATLGPDGEVVDGPTPAPTAGRDDAAARDVEKKLREELTAREQEFVERETELRRRTVALETEIHTLREAADRALSRESVLAGRAEALPESIQQRLADAEQRERELTRRENELRTKFEEIRLSSEELDRKRVPLQYKERELAAWEQNLQTNKQALEIEARRVEALRQAAAPAEASSVREKEVETLRADLARKEDELRARETLLHTKMGELEKMQRSAAEAQSDQLHTEAVRSVGESKVATGVRRLDDLLFGGFPTGVQVLVNGPAHTGKDVLARLFVAEGLKQGIPAIWVVTDKTHTQIRDEMALLYPAYAEKEARGMVRYVDLYSKSLGVTQAETSVRLLGITEKNAVDQLTTFTNQFSSDLKDRFGSYRLVFESVSTVTAYLDTNTTFRFLQPFVGRRKLDGAASYFLLETGMHTENDLQTLEHMMDGSVNLKVDQLKTFLSVKGIGDAQSRAWIGYTFSKRAFNLGSFSLDHIR